MDYIQNDTFPVPGPLLQYGFAMLEAETHMLIMHIYMHQDEQLDPGLLTRELANGLGKPVKKIERMLLQLEKEGHLIFHREKMGDPTAEIADVFDLKPLINKCVAIAKIKEQSI